MKTRPSFPARLAPIERTRGAQAVRPGVLLPGAPPRAGKQGGGADANWGRAAVPTPSGPDFSAVRRDMVGRLSRSGIADAAVLAALGSVERHRFVDSALHGQAYQETSLPIGQGQTISKPTVVARMIELLRGGAAGRLGRVLEIGTGCGYQAAVLSLLADEVYSVERLRGLHERARENLRTLRLANVHLLFGDGMVGYAKGAPYAGIIAAAGGNEIPAAWTGQLAIGGRLVAPVAGMGGAGTGQAIVVIERTRQGLQQSLHEPVHFVPLKSGVA